MADFDNLSAINENFDTIKALLNSIRAQGILNTSDVDKLLTGIHSKLERLNTEEDIDLIKIFLSELKQNLDERHSVLVSKFGAIESLFSNLLKNSSEMPKSAELKELFDIVATNLSVFSREVVSQKESLTDITLRLDALRSDDSQKKDIIKSIAALRPDLERLNNGFDSIVLNLNDNFKTVIKSISAMDNSENLDKFANAISNMEMSSNTILSALQLIDKKAEQVEDSIKNLATKEDINATRQKLFELAAQGHELTTTVTDLSDRYLRIDNLAEKIDASVNIVATLKSFLEESENNNARVLLEEISKLEKQLETITSDTKFEEFKIGLEYVFKQFSENFDSLNKKNASFSEDLKRIADFASSLDITSGFQNVLSVINKSETEIKTHIDESSKKNFDLQEANITRVLKDISDNAETLGSKLSQTQAAISNLCEKNFGSVFTSIVDLKNVVAQIDENSVSANNAIFSSISDRLTVFENSLRVSLDTQEQTVMQSSLQLTEQVENIKNLSNVLDYKMDSSVVEVSNIKREFGSLKTAVEDVLALDFVNTVKDLRVDLYASKQELVNIVETTNSDLSNKFTDDLYGKYELLISKLDNVEDEFKKTQLSSLGTLKTLLENISGSIVDVISYVSEIKATSGSDIDSKVSEISGYLKENSLEYVENVRDVVDVIRVQIENNFKSLEESNQANFNSVKKSISESSEDLKKEIKYSYSKLIDLQDSYKELKELISLNNIGDKNKFDDILAASDDVKLDFEAKLNSLRTILLDKITEFKQDFTCENADKVSELKFSVENLYNNNSDRVSTLVEEIKDLLVKTQADDTNARTAALAKVFDNFVSIKEIITTLNNSFTAEMAGKIDVVLNDFADVKTTLDKVDETIDEDLTRQLSIIESNFESLVSQISILFEKADRDLAVRIENEFNQISTKMHQSMLESLEAYKAKVETTIDSLQDKASAQSRVLQEKIIELNESMKKVWETQAEDNLTQLTELSNNLKSMLDENIKVTESDYALLVSQMNDFAKNTEARNEKISVDLKTQISDIKTVLGSMFEEQNQEASSKFEELVMQLNAVSDGILSRTDSLGYSATEILTAIANNAKALNALQQLQTDGNNKSDDIEALVKEHLELAKTANLEIAELNLISNDLGEKIDNITKQIQTQVELAKNSNAGISILTQWGKEHSNKVQADMKSLNINLANGFSKVDALETLVKTNQESLVLSEEELKGSLNKANDALATTGESVETIKSDVAALGFLASENGEKLENIENTLKEQHSVSEQKADLITNSVQTIESVVSATKEETTLINNGVSTLSQGVNANNELLKNLDKTLTDKVVSLKALTAEVSAGELQALDVHVNNLIEQIEAGKQHVKLCNDLLSELLKKELSFISSNVEKETDIIVGELIEQFDLLKKTQSDEIVDLTSKIEEIVNAHIYNNIEDLKSYLDIKTDNSILNCKIDNLKSEMLSSVDGVLATIKKLVDSEAFSKTLSDFRVTSEVLITSTIENLNQKLETFINENITLVSESIASTIAESNDVISDSINAAFVDNCNVISENISSSIEKSNTVVTEAVQAAFENNCNVISENISSSIEKSNTVVTEAVQAAFENNCNVISENISDSIEKSNTVVTEAVQAAFENSCNVISENISDSIEKSNTVVTEAVQAAFENNCNVISGNISDSFEKSNALLSEAVQSAFETCNNNLSASIENTNSVISDVLVDNNRKIEEKLALFDKKFVETVVDKYEEIKLLSNNYNTSISEARDSISRILSEFSEVKFDIGSHIDALVSTLNETTFSTNAEIKKLADSFEDLKSQISSKSFDEAFQASINKQIGSLESLIIEQLGYIEEISDLCSNNLPDVSELNMLVKHSLMESVQKFSEKLDSQDIESVIEAELKETKSEIITQLINIFNQISFVAEQEEILDFIQEKHDELITILSHIVTTADDVNVIRENISNVDYKIDNLKDEISQINHKISSIISSSEDVDYIYSLQDLESDIVNVRLGLKELQEKSYNKEFEDLISSTNEVYALVEAIKTELPNRNDFESMAEDLVSISTRTNKLILASDESYKTLQDNLQEFKHVVNDLDERTKNFAEDSGLNKINNKLNSINSMMQNGAKTTQVFNQVFEYLAEWVDNAGVQISSISDKVESLDEITQIKTMIEDLKSESRDSNAESVELVETLGIVFDKQAKRISSLETKLDKIIVETTINNKNNKLDLEPIENTINKFLVAMDEKFSAQQAKIESLESILGNVLNLIDEKDTAQLTKKVGGMDRQIAKLNKSIEKIASHVVEK